MTQNSDKLAKALEEFDRFREHLTPKTCSCAALVDDMRQQVIYKDKVEMPIQLYERIKEALAAHRCTLSQPGPDRISKRDLEYVLDMYSVESFMVSFPNGVIVEE